MNKELIFLKKFHKAKELFINEEYMNCFDILNNILCDFPEFIPALELQADLFEKMEMEFESNNTKKLIQELKVKKNDGKDEEIREEKTEEVLESISIVETLGNINEDKIAEFVTKEIEEEPKESLVVHGFKNKEKKPVEINENIQKAGQYDCASFTERIKFFMQQEKPEEIIKTLYEFALVDLKQVNPFLENNKNYDLLNKIENSVSLFLEKEPNNKRARIDKALLLYYKQQWQDAIIELDNLIQANNEYENMEQLWCILGISFTKLNKYTEAEKCFERAINLDQIYTRALVDYGSFLVRTYNIAKAQEIFKKAIELQPKSTSVLAHFADVYRKQGNFEKAISLYDQALSIDNHDIFSLQEAASCCIEFDEIKKGIFYINHAIEIDQNNEISWYYKGLLNLSEKKDETEMCLKKALDINPKHILSLLGLALVEFENNNQNKVIEFLNKAIFLKPIDEKALSIIAVLYNAFGDDENTKKYYNLSITANPFCPETYQAFGDFYLEKNDLISAKDSYEKALKLDPGNPMSLVGMARLMETNGKMKSAIDYYKKAIESYPDLSTAWFGIGLIYINDCEFLKSKEYFKKVIDLRGDDPSAWFNLGLANSELDIVPEAIDCFEKVVELEENNSKAWSLLGRNYMKQGNQKKAERCYIKALSLDPNNANTVLDYGVYLWKIGATSKAKSTFEKSVQLDPNNKPSWLNLSRIYFESHKYLQARDCLKRALDIDPKDEKLREDYKNICEMIKLNRMDFVRTMFFGS